MEREELLAIARTAALHAYAPYSHFRVGAALVVETSSGPQIVTGVDVENASFGLTICAERSALVSACALYADSSDRLNPQKPIITHLAVACIDAAAGSPSESRTPCGACRQWFAELAPHATFYIDGILGEFHLNDLLPIPFRLNR